MDVSLKETLPPCPIFEDTRIRRLAQLASDASAFATERINPGADGYLVSGVNR